GDLVAVQAVEDASGLLGVHQVGVQLAGVLRGGEDRGLGDLVEDHPLDRDLGLEDLEQVPRDGLTLAVGVCGQQELVHAGQFLLELGDLLLLVRAHHVDGLEVVVGVDPEPRPPLLLVLGGDVRGALGQVADVPDRRLHDVVRAEVRLDLAGLGGGLDDHQAPCTARCCLLARPSTCSHPALIRLRPGATDLPSRTVLRDDVETFLQEFIPGAARTAAPPPSPGPVTLAAADRSVYGGGRTPRRISGTCYIYSHPRPWRWATPYRRTVEAGEGGRHARPQR